MMTLLLLLAVVGAPEGVPFRLVLLSTEGGINPGEERITLDEDGAVTVRRWRLAQKGALEERWAVPPATVAAVREALEDVRFDTLPEVLNEASGSVVAFSTSVEVRAGERRHTVTAYRHGTPPPPDVFVALVAKIRELLLAERPTIPAP